MLRARGAGMIVRCNAGLMGRYVRELTSFECLLPPTTSEVRWMERHSFLLYTAHVYKLTATAGTPAYGHDACIAISTPCSGVRSGGFALLDHRAAGDTIGLPLLAAVAPVPTRATHHTLTHATHTLNVPNFHTHSYP